MLTTMTQQPIGEATPWSTLTSDDLVTGEAVALDLPPASIAVRMASGLIDVVVTLGALVAIVFLFMLAALQTDGALMHVAWIGTLITVFLVIPTALETLTRGRSLGKLATGLRTVRDDGGPISAQHAFVRALIGFVEIYAFSGAPAFFSALLSARGKRLGDYAAGTYVVRERVRLTLPPPVSMPPPLASWARRADITSLPPGLAVAVRQFLGRASAIDPGSRRQLGDRLAGQVAPYVAPPPPPGTPPEAFLAAVIASRRERDSARLEREETLRRRLTARR
jgi:uncharacterized RDD family membrane protein YckC